MLTFKSIKILYCSLIYANTLAYEYTEAIQLKIKIIKTNFFIMLIYTVVYVSTIIVLKSRKVEKQTLLIINYLIDLLTLAVLLY